MTEKKLFNDLLDEAGGDPYAALMLAVKCIGTNGLLVSAGFVRDCPYDRLRVPEQRGEVLDV